MFDLLLKRYVERLKREDARAGIEWQDEKRELVAETEDEMFEVMKMFATAHPGD